MRVSLFPACVIRGLLAELCSRGVFRFLSLFVRSRVVLFCGLMAERQYNPPSSSFAFACLNMPVCAPCCNNRTVRQADSQPPSAPRPRRCAMYVFPSRPAPNAQCARALTLLSCCVCALGAPCCPVFLCAWQACSPGTFSTAGSSTCTSCPQGQFIACTCVLGCACVRNGGVAARMRPHGQRPVDLR